MTSLPEDLNRFDLSASVGVAVVVLDVTFDEYLVWWRRAHPELGGWASDQGGQILLGM